MENLKAQSHSQGLVTSQGPERDPANHRRDTDRTDFFYHLLMRPSIFKDFFLLMWTMFKVFIEFVTVLLPFYVLAFWDRGVWDLTFLTRDQPLTLCIERQSPNHSQGNYIYISLSLLC